MHYSSLSCLPLLSFPRAGITRPTATQRLLSAGPRVLPRLSPRLAWRGALVPSLKGAGLPDCPQACVCPGNVQSRHSVDPVC